MAEFNEITLSKLNPQVTLNVAEKSLYFAGVTQTIEEFDAWASRIGALLKRYRLVAPVESTRSYGAHPFLLNNIGTINAIPRDDWQNYEIVRKDA